MTTLNLLALGAFLISMQCAVGAAPPEDGGEQSCSDDIGKWAAAAVRRADATELHIACKAMPSDPARSIVALAYINRTFSEDEPPEGNFDLDVLIVDSGNGNVLRKLHLPEAIRSDSLMFRRLGIDTARYRLAPGVRAFGVTLENRGSSRVYPSGSTELMLFVEQKGALRRVLEQLYVSEDSGEWNLQCAGAWTFVLRTVAIGKAGAHGFADLDVTERSRISVSDGDDEKCVSVEQPTKVRNITLRYRGGRYQTVDQAGY